MENKVVLTEQEKEIRYSKYFYNKLAIPDQSIIDIFNNGPMDMEHVVNIENRNDVLEIKDYKGEVGYCKLEDGSLYVANVTKMLGVTPEMIEWWFVWHGLKPLRYKIWDKEDHYDVQTNKKEQLLDDKIPVKERIWGVSHTVIEDIGFGPEKIVINFENPENIFDRDKINNSSVKSIICANGTTALMAHLVYEVDGGIELRSRFWIGYNLKDGEIVRVISKEANVPDLVARKLGLHCIKEYTNLAELLPKIYNEEFNL